MNRMRVLGGMVALAVVLAWSTDLAPGWARLNEGDLRGVWGEDPVYPADVNNKCIGNVTCNCTATACQTFQVGGQTSWVQNVVSNATVNGCVSNARSNGLNCISTYPQNMTYCATTTTSTPNSKGQCVLGYMGQYCGLQPPNSATCQNAQAIPSSNSGDLCPAPPP